MRGETTSGHSVVSVITVVSTGYLFALPFPLCARKKSTKMSFLHIATYFVMLQSMSLLHILKMSFQIGDAGALRSRLPSSAPLVTLCTKFNPSRKWSGVNFGNRWPFCRGPVQIWSHLVFAKRWRIKAAIRLRYLKLMIFVKVKNKSNVKKCFHLLEKFTKISKTGR